MSNIETRPKRQRKSRAKPPAAGTVLDHRRKDGRFVPIEAWRQDPAAPGTFIAWAQGQSMGSADLAEFFGLNRATVLELLAGRRWPSARTAMQIAESTGDAVWSWDIRLVAGKMRVRVRPPEPRPWSGKRR